MALPQVLVLVSSDPPQYARDGKLITEAIAAAGMKVTQSTNPADLSTLAGGPYQVVVLYTFGDYLDGEQIQSLATWVRNGGGLVGVHTAIATNPGSETLGKLLGARIKTGAITEHKVQVTDPDHPIAHRIQDFRMDDELYVTEPKSDFRPFLATWFDAKAQPMGWTREEGRGNVAYLGNGHTPGGLSHPTFRKLLTRCVRFAAGEQWAEKTVKVAAIGYGGAYNMGKLHLESCRRARLTPVAVCDVDPKRAAQAIADFGPPMMTFNHVDRLLAESDCELVTVITPHNTHATLSIQALEAGRHVVTEKPYTITVEEATRVIETGRRVGKMATVFHNRRWDGDFQVIKQLVQSGAIGDVFHIECAWGDYKEPKPDWWRAYKDISGGAIFDWGAHFVDWILNLMPHRIESVSGDFKKLKWHHVSNEDYTNAYIRFEGGRSAFIEQGSLNAIPKPRWRILGTCGGIEKVGWDWDGSAGLKLVTFQNGQRIESKVPYDKNDWDGFYRNVADHLLLDEPLAVTPESARKVIAVLNLAEESSKQGGKPLPLPFEQ